MSEFDSNSKPIKFKRKKIKLREPYYYAPNIQAYVERIKGNKIPYFLVDFPTQQAHKSESLHWLIRRYKMPITHFYFYYEDVKGEFLVTYIIFGECKGETKIDYQESFKIKN